MTNVFTNIFKIGTLEFAKITNLSLGILILLVQLFVLVNIPAFFPENSEHAQLVVISYLLLYALIFAINDLRTKLLNMRLTRIGQLFLWYFGTLVVMLGFAQFIGVQPYGASFLENLSGDAVIFFITLLIYQVFIVAIIEEFVFRDFLMNGGAGFRGLGIIWSSVIFGLFHWWVYDFQLVAMLAGMAIGFIFGIIKRRFDKGNDNLENSGVHAGYNTYVSGGLSGF